MIPIKTYHDQFNMPMQLPSILKKRKHSDTAAAAASDSIPVIYTKAPGLPEKEIKLLSSTAPDTDLERHTAQKISELTDKRHAVLKLAETRSTALKDKLMTLFAEARGISPLIKDHIELANWIEETELDIKIGMAKVTAFDNAKAFVQEDPEGSLAASIAENRMRKALAFLTGDN